MRENKLLTRDLSRGSVRQSHSYSTLLKHSMKSIASRPQVFSANSLTFHRGNATKAYPSSRSLWSRFPLRSFSTKDGVSMPPAQSRQRRSTLSWRVKDMPASYKTPRMADAPRYMLVHSRTSTQGGTPCSHTLSRTNTSTNTHKACAKPKDLITKHFG